MAVYKNAVVMFAGGEHDDSSTVTRDFTVRFEVDMPTMYAENGTPVAGAAVTVKAPEGYEVGSADIAEDYTSVTISFVTAGGGGGGGGLD